MLYVGVDETSVRWAIDHVRAGAEEAGRDPDTIKLSLLTAMWVSDDQDEAWNSAVGRRLRARTTSPTR